MPRLPLPAVASGLLLALSFPPFPSGPLPFVALIPFAVHCARLPASRQGSAEAAQAGLWLGVAFFGVLLHWVAFSLPGRPLLGVAAYLSAVALLALISALIGWLLHGAVGAASLWIALPLAWTATEWVRGSLPGGLAFPWAGTALALAGVPRALGLLPWVGEQGVALWVGLVNGLLAAAILTRGMSRRSGLVGAAVLVAAVPFALPTPRGVLVGAPDDADSPLALRAGVRVALLQTAVPVDVRRDPLAGADQMAAVLDRELSRLEPGSVDLVVLPETAFPLALEAPEGEVYLEAVRGHAARLGAPILVGAFGRSQDRPSRPYNSVFLVGPAGITARYDKRRLVPVIERTPFASSALLAAVGDTTSYGVGAPPAPLRVGNTEVAVLVCFETAFAELSRAYRREGAQLLVNVTNDAWFGDSFAGGAARAQHEAHAVLRAIEGRVDVLRVANGGRSALVEAGGRVTPVAALGEEGVRVLVAVPAGAGPPAVRTGGWVGPLTALAALLLVLIGRRRRGRAPISGRTVSISSTPAG